MKGRKLHIVRKVKKVAVCTRYGYVYWVKEKDERKVRNTKQKVHKMGTKATR